MGGASEDNFRLQSLVAKARQQNMPKKILDAAIARGSDPKASIGEDRTYEGHGPGGCCVLVQANTDNPKRTAPNLRKIFNDGGGSLGDSGSVAWAFESGVEIRVEEKGADFETLLDVAAEAGADDALEATVEEFSGEELGDGDADGAEETPAYHIVVCGPDGAADVHRAIKGAGFSVAGVEFVKTPSSAVDLDDEQLDLFEGMVDALLEHPDVRTVFHNVRDIPTKLEAE
jgi:transcriptional/translational regulatory protein YebC/TACO1